MVVVVVVVVVNCTVKTDRINPQTFLRQSFLGINIVRACVRACVFVCSVCLSLASDSSESIEVIIIKLVTGDCFRHENASSVNYFDADLHSRSHTS